MALHLRFLGRGPIYRLNRHFENHRHFKKLKRLNRHFEKLFDSQNAWFSKGILIFEAHWNVKLKKTTKINEAYCLVLVGFCSHIWARKYRTVRALLCAHSMCGLWSCQDAPKTVSLRPGWCLPLSRLWALLKTIQKIATKLQFFLSSKIFLEPPSAPIYTNFEGERAPKKRVFLSKFSKKCSKKWPVFSKNCLRRRNLAKTGSFYFFSPLLLVISVFKNFQNRSKNFQKLKTDF